MSVLDPRTLSFDELIRREWLITNGAGGYASSTVIGLNTRKYHGLLVAATRSPVGRMVILSRVEETVTQGGRSRALACVEYPGVIHPAGHELLRAFGALPYPRWAYQSDGWTIEKSVRFSPSGPNDLVITYALLGGGEMNVRLVLRPLFALRPIHELSFQSSGRREVELPQSVGGPVRIVPTARSPGAYFTHDGDFEPRSDWYLSTIYRRERERGYAGLEDLWTPGTVTFELRPGQPVHFAVSTDPIRLDAVLVELRREDQRRCAPARSGGRAAVDVSTDTTLRLLEEAGERFFVWTSPTDAGAWTCVIPQFPWTPLSVRDILISVPGLLLVPGKFASARTFLTKLAGLLRDGLIPSELSETGEAPAYNAADTSLWFIHVCGEYLRYCGNDDETAARLLPILREIIGCYRTGTKLGIGIDAAGLLRAREPGIGVTWMNARVGNWVITPRHCRPVELNALWYNALRVVAGLSARHFDPRTSDELNALADEHFKAFNRRFWNDSAKSCYDVAYDTGGDPAIRPNQVLALSLPHPVLAEDRWAAMISTVHAKLLTPFGLRTLAPDDPAYQGRYGGDVVARDRAYHQGSVYPWLLGPYASAVTRALGRDPGNIGRLKAALRGCLAHLQGEGLGTLPELFDGDPPHRPGGAIADARGVAEITRAWAEQIVGVTPVTQLPNLSRTRQLRVG